MRLPLVDLMKAVAAQLIVLHHLAFYGPMSDAARRLAPALIDGLARHGRLAVQVFLVLGGFLAARALASRGSAAIAQPLELVWRRYCRLALPLAAALVLAVACAALARTLLPLESTPAPPTVPQFVAHLFLLQNLLGYEALSAGVWYVAIDFQLYVLMVAMLRLSRRQSMALVAALAVASLFHFNRIPAWDDWALYFFGAYGMGAMAFRAGESRRPGGWLALITLAGIVALALDFRSRIVVALATAVLLGLTFPRLRRPSGRLLAFLADNAYALFLVHYPVCLVVNAAFGRLFPAAPVANAIGIFVAWGLSLLAAALFHRHVERPAAAWLGRKPLLAASPAG